VPDAGSKVTLRPVSTDDSEFLFRVYASTRVEELAPVPWSEDQKRAFLQQQFQVQDSEYRRNYLNASFDVIEVEELPAGRLYINRGPDDFRIIDIALLPEYRGHGVGSALIEGLLAEASTAQTTVSIHVERQNPARRLYERLGFQPIATHGIYLLMEATP
jgi:ribosomal protein S18 acetylase RimI-like enzyme